MSELRTCLENTRYEQACDQAIAMCDGNLRSTIKALIMANEYLEVELQEMQAACRRHSKDCREQRAMPPDRSNRSERHGRCHLLRRTAICAGR